MVKNNLKIGTLLVYTCKSNIKNYGNILKIIRINYNNDSNPYNIVNLTNKKSKLIAPHKNNVSIYISPLKKFIEEMEKDNL